MSGQVWGYFIYYRLAPGSQPPWSTLLREVAEQTGIKGRLYGPAPDGSTWMEVYEPVSEAGRDCFERALDRTLAATGFSQHLPAGERRHVEAFPRAAD